MAIVDMNSKENNFKEWLINVGKSENTAKKYQQAITGTINRLVQDAKLSDSAIEEFSCHYQFNALSNQIKELPSFREMNERGKGMYSAALNQFHSYLIDTSGQMITEDVESILAEERLSPTEKTTLVSARVGQGQFRAQLINHWQGCSVTKYSGIGFLVASHVKPWRDATNSERLDPYNGFLLLPNLDKAFDLGYISFSASGKVLISEALEEKEVLGVEADMRVALLKPHQDYLAYHRESVYIDS